MNPVIFGPVKSSLTPKPVSLAASRISQANRGCQGNLLNESNQQVKFVHSDQLKRNGEESYVRLRCSPILSSERRNVCAYSHDVEIGARA